MKTAKTKKRNFSPAQLRAQARFAKAAKAGTLKRKKRNTTIIKARKISHLDVSKVHNGLASAKKRPIAKKRNAEHRDAKHPIHVRDYWQGRTGYKSQWQRAHEAGQRQLFGVKNPYTPEMSWAAQTASVWHGQGLTKTQVIKKLQSYGLSVSDANKAFKYSQSAIRAAVKSGFIVPKRDLGRGKPGQLPKKTNPRRGMRLVSAQVKSRKAWLKEKGLSPSEITAQLRADKARLSKTHGSVKKAASTFSEMREYARQARSAVKNGRRRTVKARKNGANTSLARKRRSEFVGRPSTQMKTLYAPAGSGAKGTLSQLGKLHKISVKGGKVYNFRGVPTLAQHPKTDQLFVLGKNYTVNVPKKNPGDRMVDLGEVTRIEYEAVKTHLGDTKPVTYYHHFGEEGGKRPHALVNEEGLIIFSGGDYYIRPEGIRD